MTRKGVLLLPLPSSPWNSSGAVGAKLICVSKLKHFMIRLALPISVPEFSQCCLFPICIWPKQTTKHMPAVAIHKELHVPPSFEIGIGRLRFSLSAIKRCVSLSACRSLQEARAESPPLELAAVSPMSETTFRATRAADAQVLAWANYKIQIVNSEGFVVLPFLSLHCRGMLIGHVFASAQSVAQASVFLAADCSLMCTHTAVSC